MQYIKSPCVGHGNIKGRGKSSDSKLLDDQFLDYMLDNYAKEITRNH